MPDKFNLRVNGRDCQVEAEPNTPLLYILRNDLKLKGTRFGCGEGHCGACNVLLDGNPVQSCDTPLWSVPGHDITTIEGIGEGPGLHHFRGGAAPARKGSDRCADRRGAGSQPLSMRHARQSPAGDP